jgi:protein-S-isoprenylcysteine O-methyltransferase Ste14
MLLFWLWRPIPAIAWQIDAPVMRAIVWFFFGSGLLIVLYTSFLIDHFDLFGLRQVVLYARMREYSHPPFMVRSLYAYIRHPLMLGFLISIWAAPTMTVGHLVFSILLTAYIFVGTRIEERELVNVLGADYERYREATPMFFPRPKTREVGDPAHTT